MTDQSVMFHRWGDQALADAIAWHVANNPDLTAEQVEAFRAGYSQAWTRAWGTLKLNKMLKEG